MDLPVSARENLAPVVAGPRIPRSVIEIKDGRVVGVHEWMNHNGCPCEIITLTREPEGFRGSINDPEHGGRGPVEGSLEEVLRLFHSDIAARYRHLFELSGLFSGSDDHKIRSLGFPKNRYRIV